MFGPKHITIRSFPRKRPVFALWASTGSTRPARRSFSEGGEPRATQSVLATLGPRFRRCEAMTLRCRPRERGDQYAEVKRCGKAATTETLVVMGPRLHGDDNGLVCAKKYSSTLGPRFRGDERNLEWRAAGPPHSNE